MQVRKAMHGTTTNGRERNRKKIDASKKVWLRSCDKPVCLKLKSVTFRRWSACLVISVEAGSTEISLSSQLEGWRGVVEEPASGLPAKAS